MHILRADVPMCATFHELTLNFASQPIVQHLDTAEFFGFLIRNFRLTGLSSSLWKWYHCTVQNTAFKCVWFFFINLSPLLEEKLPGTPLLVQGLGRWEHQGAYSPARDAAASPEKLSLLVPVQTEWVPHGGGAPPHEAFGEWGEAPPAFGVLSISLCSSCSGHTPDMAVHAACVLQASGIHLMGEDTKRKVPWLCSAKEWNMSLGKQGTGPGVNYGIVPQHEEGDHSVCSSSSG